MKTDETERPADAEMAELVASSRATVLAHVARARSRRTRIRIAIFAVVAAVLFGSGLSLGSAVAAPTRQVGNESRAVVRIACVETPTSVTPFAYLSVPSLTGSTSTTPSEECGNVWRVSVELNEQRAAILYEYVNGVTQEGYCKGAAALSCLPGPVASPSPAAAPDHWADCSIEDGYYFEVGYSTGSAGPACSAQGLNLR